MVVQVAKQCGSPDKVKKVRKQMMTLVSPKQLEELKENNCLV